MSAEIRRALRACRRFLAGVLGVIGGLLSYFVCQGMFSGYPQYHTKLLSIIGMVLIALTGGVAWILDERRIDDDA